MRRHAPGIKVWVFILPFCIAVQLLAVASSVFAELRQFFRQFRNSAVKHYTADSLDTNAILEKHRRFP